MMIPEMSHFSVLDKSLFSALTVEASTCTHSLTTGEYKCTSPSLKQAHSPLSFHLQLLYKAFLDERGLV